MSIGNKIRVFLVDDSAVVRQVLKDVLDAAPDIEVIGSAADPIFARHKMANAWPDVIVLDVEMPRMDGITFLKRLMAEKPTPIVICSTLTEEGAQTTFRALAAGAVSTVSKPRIGLRSFLYDAAGDLVQVVRAASRANVANLQPGSRAITPPHALSAGRCPEARSMTPEPIVAIGTSTGGTQALESILSVLPPTAPGIVVVQHMPEKFTAHFAQRLDDMCALRVSEAKHGDRVLPGTVLIAPGGRHMALKRNGSQYCVDVRDGPLVNRHRPSVDVLFRSVAKVAGANAAGFILTGMGGDGARGLLEMREAGALTGAQDERTCVVFGMPKEAIGLGAAEKILPLAQIPSEIMRYGALGR